MEITKRILIGIVLILLQLVVFNRIHFFGYATPLVYVGMILTLPLHTPRWVSMLIGFCFGLMADITVNTPGIAAASLTLMGVLQQPVLTMFVERDAEGLEPSIKDMGGLPFSIYSLIMIFLFCLVFYSLGIFSISQFWTWLFSVLGSTLLTWILILFFESLRR